ncbi:MAG: NAD(P)-dependent oxidoreductase [Dehalococcoidia bacterium]
MKVFITGAKGFIGRELVSQCKKLGIEVLEADLPETDICSKGIVKLIPENIDAVIHLAALSRDPDCKNKAYECFTLNVMGTLNLIEAAGAKKAKQFIFASSEWVYDNCTEKEVKNEESIINIANHNSEYALSKLVSEANLRQKYQYGFCPVTVLRFGIIYGARKEGGSALETIFQKVRQNDEIEVGCLQTGRHFIHVSDITSGIVKSIGLQNIQILNLEGDRLITLQDIIETSRGILHKDIRVIEKDPTSASVRRISNAKAKKLLSWEPKVDLEQGLKSLASEG